MTPQVVVTEGLAHDMAFQCMSRLDNCPFMHSNRWSMPDGHVLLTRSLSKDERAQVQAAIADAIRGLGTISVVLK